MLHQNYESVEDENNSSIENESFSETESDKSQKGDIHFHARQNRKELFVNENELKHKMVSETFLGQLFYKQLKAEELKPLFDYSDKDIMLLLHSTVEAKYCILNIFLHLIRNERNRVKQIIQGFTDFKPTTPKEPQHAQLFCYYLDNDLFEIVLELVKLLKNEEFFDECFDKNSLLLIVHNIKIEYFTNPNQREILKTINDIFKEKLKKYEIDFNKNRLPLFNHLLEEHTKLTLFAPSEETTVKDLKLDPFQNVMAETFKLFLDKEKCELLINELNLSLVQFYKETIKVELPSLDRKKINYTNFTNSNLVYPNFNDDDYIGIDKKHVLPNYLIKFFREFGLAEKIYQFIGFIPANKADGCFKAGDFIVEGRYGAALFHGKYSHMIQQYLIILAIKKGYITWDINNLKEFFLKYNTMRDVNNNILRVPINDVKSNVLFSFSDPYQVSSFIMTQETFLSDCLIQSFCTGLRNFTSVLNEKYRLEFTDQDIINTYKDVLLNFFTQIDCDMVDFDFNLKIETKPQKVRAEYSKNRYLLLDKTERYNDQRPKNK